jgi:probable metal-binding protein
MSPTTLPAEIHGHDVMSMMIDSGQTYTRESLAAAIVSRFGAGARFYTCSAGGMTPEQLITFLEERGKFAASPTGFTVAPDRMCQH